MKLKYISKILVAGIIGLYSCSELDLYPLAEGSSENWYSTESEVEMALNDLYRIDFWPNYQIPYQDYDLWTDDMMSRSATTAFTNGTLNGQDGTVNDWWTKTYKCIARANTVLLNLEKGKVQLPQAKMNQFEGEARFVRAAQYAKLITYWGDVVYYTGVLDLEQSFTLAKTDKKVILKAIYADYDSAALKLPTTYGNQSLRATKGAAYAMKARIALFFGDWAIARDAAKACMDLGVYSLASDYASLFYSKTKNPSELIFGQARSTTLTVVIPDTKNYLTRLAGGWGASMAPSWYLFCSYLCTDGLPIDESPLFNPREPFKNRDPRCTATIVEFGTPWLGFSYQPHPDSLKVKNYKTGLMVTNNDNRANAQFASFNGLAFKKGIDEEWVDDYKAENTNFVMRYADVLLMYAEAKTELGEIDQTMLDASLNKVRARAYKVAVTAKTSYPAVTSTD